MTATLALSPEAVAGLLFSRGFVPATLPATDQDLALELARTCEAAGLRAGAVPAHASDFAAIRVALTALTFEAERVGRSRECRRFHPDASKRCR